MYELSFISCSCRNPSQAYLFSDPSPEGRHSNSKFNTYHTRRKSNSLMNLSGKSSQAELFWNNPVLVCWFVTGNQNVHCWVYISCQDNSTGINTPSLLLLETNMRLLFLYYNPFSHRLLLLKIDPWQMKCRAQWNINHLNWVGNLGQVAK